MQTCRQQKNKKINLKKKDFEDLELKTENKLKRHSEKFPLWEKWHYKMLKSQWLIVYVY